MSDTFLLLIQKKSQLCPILGPYFTDISNVSQYFPGNQTENPRNPQDHQNYQNHQPSQNQQQSQYHPYQNAPGPTYTDLVPRTQNQSEPSFNPENEAGHADELDMANIFQNNAL